MNHDDSDSEDHGKVFVAVARFNEAVTRKLLNGALETLGQAGFGSDAIDVVWVPGAFELPVTISVALATGRFEFAVALGAVVRGGTPHFDYVCAEAARGIQSVALDTGRAVGFGLLTCDNMPQALSRAGGDAGNKGSDAAASAIETAAILRKLKSDAQG